MKTYELKPTHENLLNTYVKDTIARNKDVFRFAKILDSIDTNCSIALDGNWGSGKTFFVKQVKMLLDAYNEFIETVSEDDEFLIKNQWRKHRSNQEANLQSQVCVYYDAWENDNDDDPVLSLVYSILKDVDAEFSVEGNTGYIEMAANLLECFTGRTWGKVVENLKSTDPLKELKGAKNIEATVKEFLDSLLIEKGNRLVIFIDELDRCKPSYAVRLLERIKHYFADDRISFIFSINTNELQHTIKQYYGNEFDASRYLDRFFDLRISLPPADMRRFYQSLAFNDSRYYYDITCGAVIKAFQFELRDIAKYIRLTKIAAYRPTHDNSNFSFSFSDGKGIQFGLFYIVPIIIGLKIYDSQKYVKFVNGEDVTPLLEVASYLEEYYFGKLLSNGETFDKTSEDKTSVTVEEKLKQAYDAIFVKEYTGNIYRTIIGECEFNGSTKEEILRTASLLSNYTDFDVI